MIIPSYLKPGDTIAITATARKVSMMETEPAIQLFESWGLKVKLATGLFSEQNQFAGDDATRAHALQELLDDPTVNAIICARGGYGTVRIIDQLDFSSFKKNPKWLIGFSDVTVLHSHILRHCGVAAVHASMAFSFQPHMIDPENASTLRTVLFGENSSYTFNYDQHNRTGKATAKLVGGNLSVLYSLLGSQSDLDTTGTILFLEDLDEYVYHIDRMMMNMKRNGKLSNLAGMVIGGMNDMKDNTIPFGKNAHEIIAEHVAEYSYPVAFGFPAGHEKKNLALVFGESYTLDVQDQNSTLQKNN
jgi:muramoyltetrapeptide carboxypeptidase